MHLILYTKPGCHLCEGLQEKLKQMQDLKFELEIRDITTSEEWFEIFQLEIPVLYQKLPQGERIIPRFSPRISVVQLEKNLKKYLSF